MYKYFLFIIFSISACLDPAPTKVIDLRPTEPEGYVELQDVNNINTWGDFIKSLCSQSGAYKQPLYSDRKNIFFRLSLSADTLLEVNSNDDYVALSPFFYCGFGHSKKMISFYQIDNELRFNGGVIHDLGDLKRSLKSFYQLDSTSNYHLSEEVSATTFKIALDSNFELNKGVGLIKKIVLTYLELREEYPNDIPNFQFFLTIAIIPPPPPPPPG
ncbi:MAG TPA: hypothetical protein VJ951_14780 [Bacteroidales bacterium]|nr:hypothetical protein [Bacteroidales bacterium]